jgi:hypothetical protein
MSIYRQHMPPAETQDAYIERIERAKRGVVPVPLPVPATPTMGLAMAPMGVPFA